ncbi:MAG: hypothetical protein Q8L87_00110 [Anaerolineales bacterium]|nr:hypothetical protein [Anaerolineales bacterium]
MAETHVISALVAKRSELMAHYRKEITRLSEEVQTLDATIKLFEPDYRIHTIKPKRYQKKNVFFKHGEGGRAVLDILRDAVKPLSTNAITSAAMLRNGISSEHEKLLQASVLSILYRHKKKGVVVDIGKDDAGWLCLGFGGLMNDFYGKKARLFLNINKFRGLLVLLRLLKSRLSSSWFFSFVDLPLRHLLLQEN